MVDLLDRIAGLSSAAPLAVAGLGMRSDEAGFAWPDTQAGIVMAGGLRVAVDEAARGALRTVVLVEGLSDRAAVGRLAVRRGRDLVGEGVALLAMGGVTNTARFLARFGPGGFALTVAGLYDAPEEREVRRGLERVGLGVDLDLAGMERLRFFGCSPDLEGELIAAIGPPAVESVVEAAGELPSFRVFQGQPAQQGRSLDAQLRRFFGTRSGRKIRYGTLLVDALDLARVPPPLDRLLAAV